MVYNIKYWDTKSPENYSRGWRTTSDEIQTMGRRAAVG